MSDSLIIVSPIASSLDVIVCGASKSQSPSAIAFIKDSYDKIAKI